VSDYLAEKQAGSLYGDWLPKYQHIERLGHDDCQGLLNGEVIIQNKMDGANLTIAHDPDKGVLIASRNNTICVGGHPASGFNGAIEYVLDHPHLQNWAKEGFILRGEWCVRHSLTYRPEVYRKFYLFDVQDTAQNYIHYDVYSKKAQELGVLFIPELARLTNPFISEIEPLSQGPDDWGAAQKEGIVVKNYSFVKKWHRTTWGKLVSADFREKNKLEFGATRYDPVELKYASMLTQDDVLKVIHKLKDEHGETSVKHMGEVIGRVWHDHWEDRLWDFVKKEKVKTFSFADAQKLVIAKTRDIALAYYNGTLISNDTRKEVVDEPAA